MIDAAAVLVQITVVVVAAAAATRLLGRTAALRHAVWLGALDCVLVSPLLAILAGRLGMGWLRIDSPPSPANVSTVQETPWVEPLPVPVLRPDSEPKRETTEPAVVPQAAPSRPIPVANIPKALAPAEPWRVAGGTVTLVWLAGAAWMLLRLLDGVRRLVRLRHGSAPLCSPRMESVLNAVRRGLGVDKLPLIRTSPAAPGPVAIGVLFPCVLLPNGLADALDDGQLRDVLIHEGTHLLRRDPLIGLLQRLAAALFWPHPLLHYLNRRLARAREEVCDDFVLRAGDPAAYARTLLLLSERGVRLPAAAPGLLDPKWKLEDRVAGLLDPRRTPMTRVSPLRFAGLAAGLLAVCAAGAVVCVGGEPAKENKPAAKETKATDADPSKAVIEGTVVDEKGKPIADAVVRFLSYVPPPGIPPTRTATDGLFRLVVDAKFSNGVVAASTEDGERQGILYLADISRSPTIQARIVMKPFRPMTVRVTDAANAPIKGAAVGVLDDALLVAQAETDATGKASLRLPRDAQITQVVALKPGSGCDYFENYRSRINYAPEEPPADVALKLDGARTITVRVVDSADKPLAGVTFYPWTIHKKGKLFYVNISGGEALKYVAARTDRDGLASFDWIPKDAQDGVIIIGGNHEGWHLPQSPSTQGAPPYDTLTAKLFREVPIHGKAALPDGKPAPGVLLQVEGRGETNDYFRGVVRTKADGTYSLAVSPNQTYIIAVTDDDWAAPSKTGVVVGETAPQEGFDFRLGKGTLVRGKVTAGPSGKVADQTITLIEVRSDLPAQAQRNDKTESLVRWTNTDADGRYAFRVGSGHYRIMGQLQRNEEEVVVKDEENIVKDFHIAPQREVRRLKGVVLAETPDGKPVAGAFLSGTTVLASDAPGDYKAVADDKGRYEFQRDPAKMFLYARNPKGTLAAIVAVGEKDGEATLVLSSAGQLRGRILDNGGKPLAGASLLCNMYIGPDVNPEVRTALMLETDEQGRFAIVGVVPGTECVLRVFYDQTEARFTLVKSATAETLDVGDLKCGP